jgi:hypothetical protein
MRGASSPAAPQHDIWKGQYVGIGLFHTFNDLDLSDVAFLPGLAHSTGVR